MYGKDIHLSMGIMRILMYSYIHFHYIYKGALEVGYYNVLLLFEHFCMILEIYNISLLKVCGEHFQKRQVFGVEVKLGSNLSLLL